MATSSGASVGRFLLATLLAAALLAAMPAAASAASQRLSAERAIAIASSDPKVRPLLLANPGAHWEAVYDKGKDTWTVVLEPIGSHLVLATYRIDDDDGTIIKSDVSPPKSPPRLNSSTAEQLARRQPKLQDWIDLYPKVSASAALGDDRIWTVRFYDTDDNEVAEVKVDDNRMEVTDVRTGPQVGWMQARGLPDTYGRLVNRWWLLVPMSLLFIAGLMDWRRPLSLRTLDLLVLASFAISLRFFNHGEIFWATPLVYPPMLYLAARMIRIGFSSAPRRSPDRADAHADPGGRDLRAGRLPAGAEQPELEHPRRRLRQRGGGRPADRRARALGLRSRRRTARRAPATGRAATRWDTSSARRGAASRRSRPATPTARRSTSRTSRSWRSSGGAACGTTCRRRTSPHRPSTSPPSSGCSSRAGGWGRAGWACCWRSAGRPTRSRCTRST